MPAQPDSYNLARFVHAQDNGDAYRQALKELRQGQKQGHWMWFVFPQIVGLGHSSTAQHFAISGLDEAVAYLEHQVFGPRLRECAFVLTSLDERDPIRVLGQIDAMKLRSSMTLFSRAAPDEPVFREVLDQYFGGELDHLTLDLL